jgi:hypothetical protein
MHDAPPAIALLYVVDRKRCHLGSSEAAAKIAQKNWRSTHAAKMAIPGGQVSCKEESSLAVPLLRACF